MGNIKVSTNLLDSPAHSGPGKFGRLLAQHISTLGVDLLPSHALLSGAQAYIGSAIVPEPTIIHCKKNHIPVILRLDGVGEVFPYGTYNADFTRVKFSHANADHVIYQSDFACEYVQKATNFIPTHYSTILNGIAPGVMSCGQTAEHVRHRYISICNNWNRFRYFNFLHAIYNNLPEITRNFPDFKWVIVGKHDEFKNITTGPNGNKHIEWVDFTNNLDYLRSTCGAVIHIVGKDSCPNSLIESMSHGLPAITWKESGGPEIAGNGGITIGDHQPDTIVNAMHALQSNYANMCLAAYHQIVTNCNILDTAVKYKEAIDEAMNE